MPEYVPLAQHKNHPDDNGGAKELHQSLSPAEQRLWNTLRISAKVSDFKFRRRQPIHPYIVDFVCLHLKLVIEIDSYSRNGRQDFDAERTAFLEQSGYKVLRFANQDVYDNLDGVV
jgi:very-short-patch-repair endonuclease